MIIRTVTAAAALLALATPVVAQQSLKAAVTAAMGEAIEDPRYADILAGYGLELPDPGEQGLVNSADYPYPEIEAGTLLEHVMDRGDLRLGWIAVGAPWSVPGPDPAEPVGLSIEYWALVQEKLNAHYGTDIALDWVEYTGSTGNNDMYLWLSRDDDPDCAASGSEGCYDIIGGAYAINAQRKEVSDITPAYYPLNMSLVRTHVPLPEGTPPLDTAEDVRAAMADGALGLALAGLADTGESVILDNIRKETGDTFTILERPASSDVLDFADTTDAAHFVLGTNVRLATTRKAHPEYCADCEFIPNLLIFGGVGFATALPE